MPARPEEALDQERPYVQKGLLGPDCNWLSKRAQQNQAGSSAIASPGQPQTFDGLTGTRLQAMVPRMRMAGELLRDIASITERLWICTKLLMMFSCAPPTLCTLAAFAWTMIMLVSRRTSIFGARWVGPRIGVSGVDRCGSRAVFPAQSALPSQSIISLVSFLETIIRRAILRPVHVRVPANSTLFLVTAA